MGKFKEPTLNMKTALLDLLSVVMGFDNGKAGILHDVNGVHHMTLKAMAKPEYGKLILLDASYADSPTGIVWTVAITAYGLRVAKKLAKSVNLEMCNNDPNINDDAKKKKKPRKLRTIQWQVNINQDSGAAIYKDVKAMKDDRGQSFTRVMNNLFAMHKELKAGQVGLLQALYPEAYATMLLIARNEIEMEGSGELRGLLDEFKRHIHNAPIPAFKAANFDLMADDDTTLIEVTKDLDAGRRASENFLRSLGALNPQPVTNAPRVLNVPQFAVPSFDDED
jgi:hypothetical protein